MLTNYIITCSACFLNQGLAVYCLFPVVPFEGFLHMAAPPENDAEAKTDLMSQNPQESM